MTNRIAIIIVSYNHGKFLADLFGSLAKITYPRESLKIFLINNNSSDNTAELTRSELIDENLGVTKEGKINISFLDLKENTGFAGGNNLAMKMAIEEGFEYVYLLNPDTEVSPDFLEKAVAVAVNNPEIGAVQSVLILSNNRKEINSWGNELHYLGFSFCGGYKTNIDSREAQEKLVNREIAVASGAGVLIKAAVLKLGGLFDESLFAYHEDVDLSWRIRLLGFKMMLASKSIVYHKYEFSRSIKKYYFMERNRIIVCLKNLSFLTLVVIFPAFLAMELGLLFFSLLSGWWREKFRAYRYFLSWKNLKKIFNDRRRIQKIRILRDGEIKKIFSSQILYQEISSPIWKYFGNPIFYLYWQIIKWIIIW